MTIDTFKTWLTEGKKVSKPTGDPHHVYHSKDGHKIHVHKHSDEYGSHLEYFNHSLNGHVKSVTMLPEADEPSKHEIENMHELENLKEETQLLWEKRVAQHVKPNGSLSIDAGGKITEMATHFHLLHWKHKHNDTFGSEEHESETNEVKNAINSMVTKSPNPEKTNEEVQNRITHGKVSARAIVRDIRREHGSNAKIVNVGHTSKAGDIPRFTRNHHNDGQENTSDVAVEVGSSTRKGANTDGTHFQGYSLKSTKQKTQTTAKNPGPNMGGILDIESRKLNAEDIGRNHLRDKVRGVVAGGKFKDSTIKERKAAMKAHRAEHHAAGGDPSKNDSPWELEANKRNMEGKEVQSKELHDHLNHLIDNGHHHVIGSMLNNHLSPDTSMRNKKVRASGTNVNNVRATVEENSDHPIKNIFKDKKTKYVAKMNPTNRAVNIGYNHPETGDYVHLSTYAPKPKGSAFTYNNMGWNVTPASSH